jgi:RNA polymerase sigma-70 factor (ECF subfamily)
MSSKYSDENLLTSFVSGDNQAYRTIYEKYWLLLYQHARTMLRNDDEAKDIVQEVFMELWVADREKLSQYSLPSFLYTVTRNKILNIIKHLKVEAKYADELQYIPSESNVGTDSLAILHELTLQIENHIQSLPPKMREIFLLSRKEYRSHKEIAAELEISDKTVKKQINNALHVLRKRLTFLATFF